jgi:hypothetical protein
MQEGRGVGNQLGTYVVLRPLHTAEVDTWDLSDLKLKVEEQWPEGLSQQD